MQIQMQTQRHVQRQTRLNKQIPYQCCGSCVTINTSMQGDQVHLQNIAKGTTKPGIESKYDCCLRHKALMTQITLPLAPHLCPDKTRKNATNTKVLKRRKTLSNEWSAFICTKLLVLGIKGTQAEPSDTNKRIALPGKCSAVTFPHSCLCIVH